MYSCWLVTIWLWLIPGSGVGIHVYSKKLGRLGYSPSDIANIIIKRNPIPPLDYSQLLWDKKEVKSVANITRKDAQYFLPLAAEIPIVPEVHEFKLEEANEALILLKQGRIQGTAVLRME